MDVQRSDRPRRFVALHSAFQRVVATLVLIALAAALTSATERLTDDRTPVFYLIAAVISTWAWGIGSGAIVVFLASVLTMHAPLDPLDEWHVNQTETWVRVAIAGSVTAAFTILIDQLRERNRDLARAVEKLQTVLELAPVGIAIAERRNGQLSMSHINDAFARMIGTERHDVFLESGRPDAVNFRVDGHRVSEEDLPMHRAIATRTTPPPQQLDVATREGQTLRIVARAAPIMSDDEVAGAVAAYVDVTEAKQREEELLRASHAKDQFLGMMSHELKTPLTIVAGNARILGRLWPNPDDTIRTALRDLCDASDQLVNNVENLLALSLSGDRGIDIEPLTLCRIIEQTAQAHRRAGHAITVHCADVIAAGSPQLVQQVLNNLLINAEKYGPAGAPIDVSTVVVQSEVRVIVRDRGVGLREEELEAVFEPFYRSPRTAGTVGGLGIGLAVCRQLVEAMGGRMWAANRAGGGGAEFVFTLRLAEE